jgi:adenine-specific DNA-methyltransferase
VLRFLLTLIDIIKIDKDDLFMDFFAGSCSFAHAVIEYNRQNNGRATCISIQLPERISDAGDGSDNRFKTVADIGITRLRNVATDGVSENQHGLNLDQPSDVDVGFRVFGLSRSNFKVWDGDIQDAESIAEQLSLHVHNITADGTAEDVLYELLLKSGFPLTTIIRTIEMAGKQVASIEDSALLICLEKEITSELIDALAETNPLQVICLDEGFKGNDQLKANAVQTFKARAETKESEVVFKTV